MPFSSQYRAQVELLMRVLPAVAEEHCFALKGGTAINLFVRDLPRLSVDIDLTYVPVQPRADSLAAIDAAMKRIDHRLRQLISGAQITATTAKPEKAAVKLLVRSGRTQIKIEVTPVLRGCVYEPTPRTVTAAVENEFGFAETLVVSFADLYAGKIVAALDRQHPRDLFDVRELLAHEGIDDELRQAFIVYLISHNRPMAEVLAPTRKPLHDEFARGFQGMTDQPVTLEELAAAREALIEAVVKRMPSSHREFLISFERGAPQWDLLDLPNISALPAVIWRQQNLDSLNADVRAKLVAQLETVLGVPEYAQPQSTAFSLEKFAKATGISMLELGHFVANPRLDFKPQMESDLAKLPAELNALIAIPTADEKLRRIVEARGFFPKESNLSLVLMRRDFLDGVLAPIGDNK